MALIAIHCGGDPDATTDPPTSEGGSGSGDSDARGDGSRQADGAPAADAKQDAPAETDASDGSVVVTPRGFHLESPMVSIAGGTQTTYCYYFRTPNTESMAVDKWMSHMPSTVHHMVMYTSDHDIEPPGTLDDTGCAGLGQSTESIPSWTYSAHEPTSELALPADDGAGKPLAQVIPPNTAGYFYMVYSNPGLDPVEANVKLDAEALPADAPFTQTAAFTTYNAAIKIQHQVAGVAPTETNGGIATKTCDVPADVKFWYLTARTHQQGLRAEIFNGDLTTGPPVYSSTDWAAPVSKTFPPPYFSFDDATTPNRATFSCTYDQSATRTIDSGPSEQVDEQCSMVGFMFPATAATNCVCAGSPASHAGCFTL